MNKEYIRSENSIIVTTDKGLEERENLDNISKILKTENNIEEIENLKVQIKNTKLFDCIPPRLSKVLIAVLTPALIITILAIMIGNITSLMVLPILFSSIGVGTLLTNKKLKKIDKIATKKSENLLNDELQYQNKRLKTLNKESKISEYNNSEAIDTPVQIEKDKLIDILKRKLELIVDYQSNKKDYLKLSKEKNLFKVLTNRGYSPFEMMFIDELIYNDLVEQNNNKNIKTLKLEKK